MNRVLRQCLFSIVLSLTVFTAQLQAQGEVQVKEAVNQLIDGLHLDAAEARFDSYFGRFAADAVFLGTDRTERWSISEFKSYAKPIFESGQGWRYELVERNVSGSENIQWFDEILYNQKYGYCRGTGVVQREGTDWKIAHYSLSFLVPNELAGKLGQLTLSADSSADISD
mgnify:CR=1 FL=1|tara:strand:+ start:55 stop:564 length:510 start_codon:yes stop_codon:yes gene_type:complete